MYICIFKGSYKVKKKWKAILPLLLEVSVLKIQNGNYLEFFAGANTQEDQKCLSSCFSYVSISFAFCYKGVKVFPTHRCSWVCINSQNPICDFLLILLSLYKTMFYILSNLLGLKIRPPTYCGKEDKATVTKATVRRSLRDF